MRLNINENPEAAYYEVYCNGEKLKYCFEADEEYDIAWCYVIGGDGFPKLDEDGIEFIEYKCGKIELKDTRTHNSD